MIDELWPHWRSEWVVHRDEHLLAIDKPAGVAAHPSDAIEVSDVGARLRAWLGKKPAILHGLDREASGIMLFALDKAAARSLAEQLERGVRRRHVVGVTANPRGLRDYRRLAASALRRVAPGGALLASTNLRRMSAELFRRELIAAARDAGREVARMKTMAPPLDFPPRPGEPWHLKSERIEVS